MKKKEDLNNKSKDDSNNIENNILRKNSNNIDEEYYSDFENISYIEKEDENNNQCNN